MIHLPDTLNCDSAPYPDDAVLEQIRTADSCGTGAQWMVETFPKLAEELAPYAVCECVLGASDRGDKEWRIEFHTQGWSGCEDFINAVLGNVMLHMMYYSEWRRGGHHVFRVSDAAIRRVA